jgi:hypothetical protein
MQTGLDAFDLDGSSLGRQMYRGQVHKESVATRFDVCGSGGVGFANSVSS